TNFLLYISRSLRPLPPIHTLFPYTTLFRSDAVRGMDAGPRRLHPDRRTALAGGQLPRHVRPAPQQHLPREGVLPVDPVGRLHERSEEHTSELQSRVDLVCRLLLEKKKK